MKFCWWNWKHYILNASFRSSSVTGLKLYTLSLNMPLKQTSHWSRTGELSSHNPISITLSPKTFCKQGVKLCSVAMSCWGGEVRHRCSQTRQMLRKWCHHINVALEKMNLSGWVQTNNNLLRCCPKVYGP